uniref:Transmembrane protein n=1 Tax=Marseillevirus LCMAC102 TaxID=2506603 RepID=A0A481YTK5_9VIRU|nr:MAG: hypothetical protein LCMAC102_01450 [Marseillevirus LCMAC102]
MKELVFVLITVVLILGFLFIISKKKSEGYGTPLGQLAPYVEQLNECINECDREDPNRRLLATGNWNCGKYCESIITDLAQKGVSPSSPFLRVRNSMTDCEKQCSGFGATHNEKRKCISMCFGRKEVGKWCKELWCPYSVEDDDECMRDCIATNSTNANQVAWTWMAHG